MARVCVIRQGWFPLDPRVRREVGALVDAGHEVDVICLARDDQPTFERLGPVTVRRIRLGHKRTGPLRYVLQYLVFFLGALAWCSLLHLRRRYRLVQVHSLPDALVFAALLPRLLGARVVLDLHEVMPEFMATKYGLPASHPLVRLVAFLEQASIRFASLALTCTNEQRDVFVGRGAPPEKIVVVHNSADEEAFDPERHRPRRRTGDGEFRLICHGTVDERYGQDTAVRALALLADEIPELRLDVIGEGEFLAEVRRIAAELGVEARVRFTERYVPLPDLVQAIADADAGIVAMRRDAFRDLTHCNKMYDLITMRKPVICSRTLSVERYFGEDAFAMFDSGDPASLADAIRRVHGDAELRRRLVETAAAKAEQYRWPRQKALYQLAIERQLAA